MKNKILKSLWIINFAAIAAAAYFLASGTSTLLAAELADKLQSSDPELAGRDSLPEMTRQRRPSPDGTPILERNLFDSAIGPILPGSSLENEIPGQELEDPDQLPVIPCSEASDLEIQLEATVVSPQSPSWSFASVTSENESRLCRVGDVVGERIVAEIGWSLLLLRGEEDVCYLKLFEANGARRGAGGGSHRKGGGMSSYEIDFGGRQTRSKRVVSMKSLLKQQNPRAYTENMEVSKVILSGKSRKGKGTAGLSGTPPSHEKTLDGNPEAFRDDTEDTYDRVMLNNPIHGNDGWNIKLQGNIKLLRATVYLRRGS
ncbi:MAG: hypothetical protein R6V85_15165 [Polyangia bacterium]